MHFSIICLLIGFVALYFGAVWLVKGSASLARATGIRPVIIALTFVAFGTSAPELLVTINASVHHASEIALGNIIGSLIANTGLILGLAALFKPMKVEFRLLKKEVPILLVSELIFFALIWSLSLSRIDGLILLLGFILFNWYCIREAKRNIKEERERVQREYSEYVSDKPHSKVFFTFFIILGIIALAVGSHMVVISAIEMATLFGISPFVIAASVVAFGTSLPELATSVIAAVKGESDIAIGNVLGSNIFNILLCLGVAALISPLTANQNMVNWDIPVMIGISLLLGIFMWSRRKIGRMEGLLLLIIYGGYLAFLFV